MGFWSSLFVEQDYYKAYIPDRFNVSFDDESLFYFEKVDEKEWSFDKYRLFYFDKKHMKKPYKVLSFGRTTDGGFTLPYYRLHIPDAIINEFEKLFVLPVANDSCVQEIAKKYSGPDKDLEMGYYFFKILMLHNIPAKVVSLFEEEKFKLEYLKED